MAPPKHPPCFQYVDRYPTGFLRVEIFGNFHVSPSFRLWCDGRSFVAILCNELKSVSTMKRVTTELASHSGRLRLVIQPYTGQGPRERQSILRTGVLNGPL